MLLNNACDFPSICGRDLFFRRHLPLPHSSSRSAPSFRLSRYRDQYIANEVQLLQDFAFQEIKQVCKFCTLVVSSEGC